MHRIKKWTLGWTVLVLSTTIWTGSVSGQDLDPNELVEVRRGDIAKCRAQAEAWAEKTKVCAAADGAKAEAQRRATELYEKNVALIRENERVSAERDAFRALTFGGATVSVILVMLVVFAP